MAVAFCPEWRVSAIHDPAHRLLHRKEPSQRRADPGRLSLLTEIPHARHLEIAVNRKSDPLSKEVVVVYGEFEDDVALAAYKAHELYAEAVRRVRPLRDLRFAADFDVATVVTGSRGG